MFLCECHHCGRRELRGPRSLFTQDGTFATTCRACGTVVPVASAQPTREARHPAAA
jgi:hypothetical protein